MSQSAKQRAASLKNLAKARAAHKGKTSRSKGSRGAAPHNQLHAHLATVHQAASPVATRTNRLRKVTLHL
jgi:hypothetical protein